ncbi:MAG: tRNA 2-thiocytidine biosynthesis protein TtcA [Prevotella sp.]|nr:tRNA 2-thiocytidine biosynthesis protein TtcA [Prevotella sp.]
MFEKDDKQLCTRINRLFNEALKRYALVEDGDRILVGLSGGKDSMALLQLLALRSRIFKPRFNVEAAFVRMKNIPYQCDEEYLRSFAESLGVRLHILDATFSSNSSTTSQSSMLKVQSSKQKPHCFLCSWNRRKRLFCAAKELECNKIALGHNKDDIIQTALMNLTFEGTFSTMRPMMKMDKFDMTIIRPLCLIREHDLQEYAEIQAFRKQVKNCPFEDASHRHDMKGIIAQLEEMNPEFSYSFFHAIMKDLNFK